MVIADRLAVFVNEVYNQPDLYQGFPLIWATYFFAFQIYCDFSGYSDIAIGASRVMGIDLMENFRTPYFSQSIREFWTRWHISLSTWFKSYLYIPLGGNRVVKWRRYYNLLIVFVLSGFWHGANWTFITWGLLHGFYLVIAVILGIQLKHLAEYFTRYGLKRVYYIISVLFTFHLVLISWVLFRAESISDAWYIIMNAFNTNSSGLIGVPTISTGFFTTSLFFIGFLLLSEGFRFFTGTNSKPIVNYIKVFGLVVLIYLFGIFEKQEFIYFQF
ncbi:MAG: MBOAT family O-acyltransferase [Bacteroidota bacterium]